MKINSLKKFQNFYKMNKNYKIFYLIIIFKRIRIRKNFRYFTVLKIFCNFIIIFYLNRNLIKKLNL